jgi:hypothetical protein
LVLRRSASAHRQCEERGKKKRRLFAARMPTIEVTIMTACATTIVVATKVGPLA